MRWYKTRWYDGIPPNIQYDDYYESYCNAILGEVPLKMKGKKKSLIQTPQEKQKVIFFFISNKIFIASKRGESPWKQEIYNKIT